MQILKDEIRNRILKAALIEFKREGFAKASMRNIARAAGVTSGNIYRYFASKDGLFDAVVQPVHEKYAANMADMRHKIDLSYTNEARNEPDYFNKIEAALIELFKTFTAELTILFNRSEGSEYENVKSDLIALSFATLESMFLKAKSEIGLTEYETALARMIAASLVEGICLILRDNEEGDTFNRLVDQHLRIYSHGIKDVINQMES